MFSPVPSELKVQDLATRPPLSRVVQQPAGNTPMISSAVILRWSDPRQVWSDGHVRSPGTLWAFLIPSCLIVELSPEVHNGFVSVNERSSLGCSEATGYWSSVISTSDAHRRRPAQPAVSSVVVMIVASHFVQECSR